MISLSGLCVELRDFALRDINLNIESGDYFVLVGPTNAGKTLLLETIAGLHRVNSGGIRINDRDITLLEYEKRNIGMVYQDCALFPHLSVVENIIFGLKMRHERPEQIIEKLNRVVQLLGTKNLLH